MKPQIFFSCFVKCQVFILYIIFSEEDMKSIYSQ